MEKSRVLEKQLAKAIAQPSLHQEVQKQISQRSFRSPLPSPKETTQQSNYSFIKEVSRACFKKNGLIATSRDERFDSMLTQFKNTCTFVSIKQVMQRLNVLNHTLSSKLAFDEPPCPREARRMFETARNLDRFCLPKAKPFTGRLRSKVKEACLHFNRNNAKSYESKLTSLKADCVFAESYPDENDPDQTFLKAMYQSLMLVKEEEPRLEDEEDDIRPEIREKLLKYKQMVQQRKRAEHDPQAYVKKFKQKAKKIQNQLTKMLNSFILPSRSKRPAPAQPVGTVHRARGQRDSDSELTSLLAKVQESSRLAGKKRRGLDEDYNFRLRKLKDKALRQVSLLIEYIEQNKFVFLREKEIYFSYLGRVEKSIEEDIAALKHDVLKLERNVQYSRTVKRIIKRRKA